MMSLFSSFDLQFNISLLSCFLTVTFLNLIFIFKVSYYSHLLMKVNSFFSFFFHSLNKSNVSKMFLLFIFSLMFVILNFNLVSMIPFGSAWSTQLSGILLLSMFFWSIMLFLSFFKSFPGFITHMMPLGTPMFLVPFIFVIELVSIMVRPITLTVRLVANILAGHLLMTILHGLCNTIKIAFIFYLLLILVELGVGLIQSYIYATLVSIYYSEM